MEAPKKGEYWTIEYGLKKKTRHIVEVLEDAPTNIKNWRKTMMMCKKLDDGELKVYGDCFIELWDVH